MVNDERIRLLREVGGRVDADPPADLANPLVGPCIQEPSALLDFHPLVATLVERGECRLTDIHGRVARVSDLHRGGAVKRGDPRDEYPALYRPLVPGALGGGGMPFDDEQRYGEDPG